MKKTNILNSIRKPLGQSIASATEYIYMERQKNGNWQSDMIGGPVHTSIALIAKAAWGHLSDSDEELLRNLLDEQNQNGLFLPHSGGKAVKGVQELVTTCIELLITRWNSNATRDLLQEAAHRARESAPSAAGGRMYSFLSRQLQRGMDKRHSGFFGFPWYLLLFDLMMHHWIFSWLRRCLPLSVLDQLPAIGLLMEAAAKRTLCVRFYRKTIGRIGALRRTKKTDSLRKAVVARQQPNGCWAWTVLGTAVNLLALHVLNENIEDQVVQRGLTYLDNQRRSLPNGKLYQSWTSSSVWDTALAAEVLLIGNTLTVGQALEIGKELAAHQTPNGLTKFDSGVAYGDNDSTAVVLSYLGKASSIHKINEPWLTQVMEKCVEGLITSQLRDGGWGFAPSRPLTSFGSKSPGQLAAVLNDASSPDLTSRVVLGLMAARQTGLIDMAILDRLDKAVSRSIGYFETSQHKDGYWWSRWSGKPIVATSLVLLATSAADFTKSTWLATGRSWLLNNSRKKTAVEEAWKLIGLITSSPQIRIEDDEEITRIATLLTESQEQKTWKSQAAYPFSYGVDLFEAPLFDHIVTCSALIFADRAFLKGTGEAKREILYGRSRSKRKPVQSHNSIELTKIFNNIHEVARKLAGSGDDIGQRIVIHYSVYRDSGRNFTFPLLALHGAGWAYGYFRVLAFFLPLYATFRFPISWRKRAKFKKSMIRGMAGFKAANQRVLTDTYANYHFTKQYGSVPGAVKILSDPLLSILNKMHKANSNGEPLTNNNKSWIYSQSFQWEQSNSVWPMVERAIREINDPLARGIAFKPIVQFAFFPWWEFLFFSDFTNTDERIEEGWKAYHIAERVGWSTTERAIGKYKILPLDLLEQYKRLLKRFGGESW